MRKIIITGLFAALVAAFAAAAAPALAHEFVAKPGKGTIQDKNIGNHVFETGGAKVECEEETSKGTVQQEKAPTNKETVLYSKCKAFEAAATVSQAKYEFKAEGTVAIENEILVTASGPKCEVKVPTAGNQNLGQVKYNKAQGGRIELKANVTGITSTVGGSGTLCPKGTNSTGKYVGISLVELIQGGTLEWV